jgi:hypothetical protein
MTANPDRRSERCGLRMSGGARTLRVYVPRLYEALRGVEAVRGVSDGEDRRAAHLGGGRRCECFMLVAVATENVF